MARERQRISDQLASGNFKKIEQALNDWLEKLEEHVSIMQDQITAKASNSELQQLDLKLKTEIRERAFQDEQVLQLAQREVTDHYDNIKD